MSMLDEKLDQDVISRLSKELDLGKVASVGNAYVSVDVGTTKVCTLVAQILATGEVEIIGAGKSKSRGMKKGLVVDIEAMTAAVRESIADATLNLDIEIPPVCIGVTGSHIVSVTTTGKSSIMDGKSEKVVSVKDMDAAVDNSRPKVENGQELLHVIPISYSLDGTSGIRNPSGLKGNSLSVKTHSVVGEITSLDNIVQSVENTGLKMGGMVLEPLASAESVLSAEEREIGTILVDIGGGTSDLAFFKNGKMVYTAVIPVGGFNFTNDIAVTLGIPYETAEELKINYGRTMAIPDDSDIDFNEQIEVSINGLEEKKIITKGDICRLLNDRASELLRFVLLKINEAGLDAMPAGGIVFTGGGANLIGWEELNHEYIPGNVRIAAPRDILGLPETLKSPTYSTSVGILLWGINHPVEQVNYGGHQPQKKKTFSKGRKWLSWLTQFISPKF